MACVMCHTETTSDFLPVNAYLPVNAHFFEVKDKYFYMSAKGSLLLFSGLR